MNAIIESGATQPVFLWAVPRSVSTAFEKTFVESGQFEVIHEPFTDCYYFGEDRRSNRYGDAPERGSCSGPSTCRWILEGNGKRRFVKELCFQAEPYVSREFLSKVTSTFIVRAPDVVLASLEGLKPDFTEDEFGFTALERIWRQVCDLHRPPPIVVDGNQFRADPTLVLRAFCEEIGARYDESMLRWDVGKIRDWEPHEVASQSKWHSALEQSHGIIPPLARDTAEQATERKDVVDRAWQVYREVMSGSIVLE
jgi:hypothetical protein